MVRTPTGREVGEGAGAGMVGPGVKGESSVESLNRRLTCILSLCSDVWSTLL